jgi:hypothetical protein
MSITNSVTAAMEFLTDSLSAFKFRSGLLDETIERTLTDVIRDRTILEGIVVSDNAQRTSLKALGNEDGVFLAAKVRIMAIHDEMFPSPVQFYKMGKSGRQIQQLIDAHPVIYSKEVDTDIKTSPTRGMKVNIEFIDGIPRWTPKGREEDIEYKNLRTDGSGGTAREAYKNQRPSLVGDKLVNASWTAGSNVILNETIRNYLDALVANLQTEGWTQFPLFVTSGVRTPEKQAQIMVDNVSANQNWWPYGSRKLRTMIFDGLGYKLESNGSISKKAAKIGRTNQQKFIGYDVSGPSPIEQYETLTRKFTKQDLIDEVSNQVKANMAGNIFVSAHLSGRAVDIQTRKINKASVGTQNIESSLRKLKSVALKTAGNNGSGTIELYEGAKWSEQRAKRNAGTAEALNFEHLHIKIGDNYVVSD